MNNQPVGIFDSGLGGLTVVKEMMSVLPNENIIYLGDTGRVPYGTRSFSIIEGYAQQDVDFLKSMDVKMIIAACGTVSSVAPHILNKCGVKSIGVVEPASISAVRATKNGKIGVIGTSATIRSKSFEKCIKSANNDIEIFSAECPMFVPLVENGWIATDDPIARLSVERYLIPLAEKGIDTLILGCTHFPILQPIIADVLGEHITLINTGREAAIYAKQLLMQSGMINDGDKSGQANFYVTDTVESFSKVSNIFLGRDIHENVYKTKLNEKASI